MTVPPSLWSSESLWNLGPQSGIYTQSGSILLGLADIHVFRPCYNTYWAGNSEHRAQERVFKKSSRQCTRTRSLRSTDPGIRSCWLNEWINGWKIVMLLYISKNIPPFQAFAFTCVNSDLCICTYISSVQSLSRVRLFATPWAAARQASLSIASSQSLLKLMSIQSVIPSSQLILCCPLSSCLQSFPASGYIHKYNKHPVF